MMHCNAFSYESLVGWRVISIVLASIMVFDTIKKQKDSANDSGIQEKKQMDIQWQEKLGANK